MPLSPRDIRIREIQKELERTPAEFLIEPTAAYKTPAARNLGFEVGGVFGLLQEDRADGRQRGRSHTKLIQKVFEDGEFYSVSLNYLLGATVRHCTTWVPTRPSRGDTGATEEMFYTIARAIEKGVLQKFTRVSF
jgi:hypothetical protein